MNILSHIHIHRLPNPSGVGRVIDRLLTTHKELYPEHTHRMLVDGHLYDDVYLNLDDHWKTASFIPHKLRTSRQQAKWVWRNKPVAENFWPGVDLVYCPAESFVPIKNAKLVCTIHDVAGFEDSLYPDSPSKRLHCFKWTALFNRMAKYADAVVTVSEFSATRIAHYFPALKNKLHVIYNAPHHIFGMDSSEPLRDEVEKLSGGQPFVLVPGGLSLRKNAQLIIDALPEFEQALPGVKLIIAGSNDQIYLDQLKASNASSVVLAGYVSDALLNALYQQAGAVWFPSRYEGFGMPVIEAMAAGAPVVTSSAASIPEVCENTGRLCDMDNTAEHISALGEALALNGTGREKEAEAGKKQAAKFTWEKSAQKLEQLFQSL